MAKKKAKKEEIIESEDLLGGNVAEIKEEEAVISEPIPEAKKFIGYHPITGVEVWM